MSGFGHVDLRVSSLEEALSFYDALMPALGFTERYHGPEWKVWGATEPALPATEYFAITESPAHVANENRIAFWAAAPAEVDRVAAAVEAAEGRDISGPKPMPYGPDYYALYFSDPCGNRFEVYFRQSG